MEDLKINYYGSLCTEMYEMLHKEAEPDELAFYLSYANKDMMILEPLCGSGRFLVPFLERGFTITGVDQSGEMLDKLIQKAPNATIVQSDIEKFETGERFDYIFISSGSVSLFTDRQSCENVLSRMKGLLKRHGKFVFAVDTVADRLPNDDEYKPAITVTTKEGYSLVLKSKSYYEEASQTQWGPSLYELYNGDELIQQEQMNFQTHLYALGEMEKLLEEIGFTEIKG